MATALITQPDRTFLVASGGFDLLSQLTDRDQLFTQQDVVSSKPDPVLRSFPVRSRGVMVHFQYLDYGAPQPAWLMPALQGFANLVTLPPTGIAKAGAGSTARRSIVHWRRLINFLMSTAQPLVSSPYLAADSKLNGIGGGETWRSNLRPAESRSSISSMKKLLRSTKGPLALIS